MKAKSYHVGLRKRNNDYYWNDQKYQFIEFKPKNKRYWIADPFLFDYDRNTFLFYEAYDRVKRKGLIGYSIIDSKGTITEPRIVLEENHHLSFPYVFEYNSDIYMMPESADDFSISVYKAIQFPNKWERIKILDGIYSCDSIWIYRNHKIYKLLTSEMFHPAPAGIIHSCYVKNKSFILNGDITHINKDKFEYIGEGDYGIRNAGACFYDGEMQIRPGQDCTDGIYGKGLIFFSVESIEPYSEKEIRSLSTVEIDKHLKRSGNEELIGVHTYNVSLLYEAVDFSFMAQIPIWCNIVNFVYRGCRKMKRVIFGKNKEVGKGISKCLRIHC